MANQKIRYIVRFNDGPNLKSDTRSFGPFENWGDAYDFLCELPAPIPGENACKYVETIYGYNSEKAANLILFHRNTNSK